MIQEAQNIARATLAACPAFQSLVDVGNAFKALDYIYHDALPSPQSQRAEHTRAELAALRPCAIVFIEDNQGFVVERDASGSEDCWNAYGIVHFFILRNVPKEDKYNLSKVDTDFRTVIGDIAEEMIGLSETAPYLAANRIVISGPARTPFEKLADWGDAQEAHLIVSWGASR